MNSIDYMKFNKAISSADSLEKLKTILGLISKLPDDPKKTSLATNAATKWYQLGGQ
jgi:hypothetical protein